MVYQLLQILGGQISKRIVGVQGAFNTNIPLISPSVRLPVLQPEDLGRGVRLNFLGHGLCYFHVGTDLQAGVRVIIVNPFLGGFDVGISQGPFQQSIFNLNINNVFAPF